MTKWILSLFFALSLLHVAQGRAQCTSNGGGGGPLPVIHIKPV